MYDNNWFNQENAPMTAKKENLNEHTFSFISSGVRRLLEELSIEHRNTMEFEFKPKTGTSQVCIIKSSDPKKVAWVVFLVERYKDTAKKLNALLLKTVNAPAASPSLERDLRDIYKIARTLLDM